MSIETKIAGLEYMMNHFVEWYKSCAYPNNYAKRSFSKLKILKLLFFTAAVNAKEEDQHLLDVFDNFHAMPFGPVESDLYNRMNLGHIGKYAITDQEAAIINEDAKPLPLDIHIERMIIESVEALKSINKDLITYTAFELVDLTHKWSCWQGATKVAEMLNKRSILIPPISIIKSDKYYVK